MGFDSVGSLLADIANLVIEGLRILGLADKRHWGQDEYELLRAMERVLDDAKKDFQELSPMLKSQSHYEHDRSFASLEDLRAISGKFYMHIQNLREWSRAGGPIDPVWVRDTKSLQRDLHRAQCRAAQRVFNTAHETSQRCLGAFIVHRKQRAWAAARRAGASDYDYQRRQVDEVNECHTVGGFERFGDLDMVFICDFCDGHLIWDDIDRIPTTRTGAESVPETPATASASAGGMLLPVSMPSQIADATRTARTPLPEWQATGITQSGRQPKQVIYPPLAIANHIAPHRGDWLARLMCPLCEDAVEPLDVDDEDEIWQQPENCFDNLAALQEHMEWEHVPATIPTTLPLSLPSADKCIVM